MEITRKSLFSGLVHTMDLPVTEDQMLEWIKREHDHHGRLIQQIFPQLTPPQREFIKTGVTPEEWKAEFGAEDTTVPRSTTPPQETT